MIKGDIYVSVHSQIQTTLLPDFIVFDSISAGQVYYKKMHKKLIPQGFSRSQIVPNDLAAATLEYMTEDEFRDYQPYDENNPIIVITNHTIHND